MILSKLVPFFGRGRTGGPSSRTDADLERRRLDSLHGTGLLDSAAPPELDAICRAAKEEFGAAMALVTLVGREKLLVTAQAGCQMHEAPRSAAFCDYTIRTNDVFVVPDMREDPRFVANPLVTGAPFVRFYAGAPLTYFRNIRLGALCLLDPTPREFGPPQQDRLAQLAAEVADIILTLTIDRKASALTALRPVQRARAPLQSLPA